MSPLELRSKISNLLGRDSAKSDTSLTIELVSPIPGQPVELAIETPDPYGKPGATRRFRIVINEL
ncbi:hypothetical protein [Streptomyces xanthophaeus]|uniref:hypothetical protein n=1 Tax=Streptomyces xanthophaeus TaxID=67385 RepID=UPI0026490632|nr:hypothetical protein [Streptomyces xanthophaeus]WKD36525.1 hypothetical protein KO717_34390 [Streptomyces xanthophaeus]